MVVGGSLSGHSDLIFTGTTVSLVFRTMTTILCNVREVHCDSIISHRHWPAEGSHYRAPIILCPSHSPLLISLECFWALSCGCYASRDMPLLSVSRPLLQASKSHCHSILTPARVLNPATQETLSLIQMAFSCFDPVPLGSHPVGDLPAPDSLGQLILQLLWWRPPLPPGQTQDILSWLC